MPRDGVQQRQSTRIRQVQNEYKDIDTTRSSKNALLAGITEMRDRCNGEEVVDGQR